MTSDTASTVSSLANYRPAYRQDGSVGDISIASLRLETSDQRIAPHVRHPQSGSLDLDKALQSLPPRPPKYRPHPPSSHMSHHFSIDMNDSLASSTSHMTSRSHESRRHESSHNDSTLRRSLDSDDDTAEDLISECGSVRSARSYNSYLQSRRGHLMNSRPSEQFFTKRHGISSFDSSQSSVSLKEKLRKNQETLHMLFSSEYNPLQRHKESKFYPSQALPNGSSLSDLPNHAYTDSLQSAKDLSHPHHPYPSESLHLHPPDVSDISCSDDVDLRGVYRTNRQRTSSPHFQSDRDVSLHSVTPHTLHHVTHPVTDKPPSLPVSKPPPPPKPQVVERRARRTYRDMAAKRIPSPESHDSAIDMDTSSHTSSQNSSPSSGSQGTDRRSRPETRDQGQNQVITRPRRSRTPKLGKYKSQESLNQDAESVHRGALQ